jgi:putative glutamine amidotransferase
MVGVSACLKNLDGHPFHAAGEKYLRAVVEGAGAQPLLIPALGEAIDWDDLFAPLDGIMLTGGPSNVAPDHYGGAPSRPQTLLDRQRDATTLPLITAAVERAMPLFAICRGFQELNVAYGGSLHQHLEEVPGRMDHRRDRGLSLAEQYAPSHPVALTPGGEIEGLLGTLEVQVNSLHGQGIDRLGEGLAAEAVAPDGTIEAARVEGAPAFALGVQWHPEWRLLEKPDYAALFAAFGAAAQRRAAFRRRPRAAGKVA